MEHDLTVNTYSVCSHHTAYHPCRYKYVTVLCSHTWTQLRGHTHTDGTEPDTTGFKLTSVCTSRLQSTCDSLAISHTLCANIAHSISGADPHTSTVVVGWSGVGVSACWNHSDKRFARVMMHTYFLTIVPIAVTLGVGERRPVRLSCTHTHN